ncbi:unnamed protein product (macronuclear) [Paramecium tetraurelia]|uniref:PPM-type phosphatase domain-containing protein n=1 Tax=Paramecium tetraurelia TaxID=5888 RepID=A0BCF0_PARTE|nr:uncharacterized protein GSPATT00004311001 [Paramecium tetraurelia]CAK56217.1 unnamed protein product [Paramecium tetraurelia]|eukprot:XP_001423615.1 hypothetical protein (macronuclear) [Paramecium tetraurelia strain d4-2]
MNYFRKANYTPVRANQEKALLLPNIFLFQQSPERKSIHQLKGKNLKYGLKKLDISTNTVDLKSDRTKDLIGNLSYQSRTLSGLNINNQQKVNQDSYLILKDLQYKLFGIYDGHGKFGHLVSSFIKFNLEKFIKSDIGNADEMKVAYELLNNKLLESNIDTQLSGSTGISVHIKEHHLFCCNVGDSKAILGRRQLMNKYQSIRLNRLHKPIGLERDRIIKFGGRIEYVYGRPRSPLRVWMQNEDMPGLAMTRSFGDKMGIKAGIIAVPEIFEIQLTKDDHFILIGSDGLFEHLSEEDICKLISRYYPLQIEKAADMLMLEAQKQWKLISLGRDDITFILIFRFS